MMELLLRIMVGNHDGCSSTDDLVICSSFMLNSGM